MNSLVILREATELLVMLDHIKSLSLPLKYKEVWQDHIICRLIELENEYARIISR